MVAARAVELSELDLSEADEAMYAGEAAEALAAEVRKAGGNLTAQDLEAYSVEVREPLQKELLGGTFFGAPPPSSGGATIIQALILLSGAAEPLAGIGDGLAAHRLVESMKHAFALRMSLGDPCCTNVTRVLRDMLSETFNAELRSSIEDHAVVNLKQYGARYNQLTEDHGTTHLSVVDAEGNAVAMTSTINTHFGSKIISRARA